MWSFLRRLFRRSAEPSPPVRETRFLAIDLETTGLDPERDHIVAIGWVPIDDGEIVLAGAGQRLVRPPIPVGESATIHGLTDESLADAPQVAEVLPELLEALSGRVLVAHHAPFDVGFLTRAHPGLSVASVDTLAVARRLLADREMPRGSFRLHAARRRHGLPSYAAHSALTDALAAAELMLAQVAELEHRLRRPATLRDLAVSSRHPRRPRKSGA
jgi:DNA polymerase-3 subunit epsilon